VGYASTSRTRGCKSAAGVWRILEPPQLRRHHAEGRTVWRQASFQRQNARRGLVTNAVTPRWQAERARVGRRVSFVVRCAQRHQER
jgi:hypothetical protein